MSAIRQHRTRTVPDNRLAVADRWAIVILVKMYRRCRKAGMGADDARDVVWMSMWLGTLGVVTFDPRPLD